MLGSHIDHATPVAEAFVADSYAAAAGTPPRDRFDELVDLMKGDTEPAEDQVGNKVVPKPPPVVVEDPTGDNTTGYDRAKAEENFSYLKDAHSVCQMFTNMQLVKDYPKGFDITKEAAQAFNVQAKLAYDAMLGPMGGVYNFGDGVHTKHSFDILMSEVHEKLLETMFDGMNLDPGHQKQIDSQITNFVKALKNITIDGDHSTLDFALRFGLTPATNITADASNPLWAFEPTTYLIYLKMDADAFKKTISKHNSQDRVHLKYEHVVTKLELNVRRFLQHRPKYDAMFEKVTGMNLAKYSKLLNKTVKK
ncbi:hypothetical protein P885DRAFT_58857 [Corynascus similis CBS 632.67]